MKKPRDPSDEEMELWREVTRDARRLKKTKTVEMPVKSVAVKVRPKLPAPPQAALKSSEPVTAGNYAGIDRANAERFRKGNYVIDSRLDLHGMDREKAYAKLQRQIATSYERQERCLLVITGKGPENKGVLRGLLVQWLNSPEIRGYILTFDQAQQRHGGSGAFYVLLKRRRA